MSSDQSLEDIVQGRWPVQWKETPRVNESYDRVLRISETHVVKFPGQLIGWNMYDALLRDFCFRKLIKGFELQKIAYDLNLSVPKPEGIFEVEIRNPSFNLPGFVMEYVPGEPLSEILIKKGSCAISDITTLMYAELDKAKALDFKPGDTNFANAIWSSVQNKIYLIDLEGWEYSIK